MTDTAQSNYSRYKKYSTDLARYYRTPAMQTSLTVVLSIFITTIFIFTAIRPTLVTITKLNKTIQESEKSLEALKDKALALEKISNTWDEVMPLESFVNNSVPVVGPNYQELVNGMEIIAFESGVTLSSEQLGEALTFSKISDPYSGNDRTVINMPFSVRVSGTFQQVSDFLNKLINIDRVVIIESISFSKDVKSGAITQGVAFNVSGSVGYLADESQLAGKLKDLKEKAVPAPVSQNEEKELP